MESTCSAVSLKTFCPGSGIVSSTAGSQPKEHFVLNPFMFILGKTWQQVLPIKQLGAEMFLSLSLVGWLRDSGFLLIFINVD